MTRQSVFCLADSCNQADRIVHRLRTAGFSNNDISALFPNKEATPGLAHEKSTRKHQKDQSPGGWWAARRGGFGSIGALDIPGVGPFVASGPLIFALGGPAIGATVRGIAGGLIDMGAPEFEARRYESKLKDGDILISVHTDNPEEISRASDIFTKAGAHDICATGESSSSKDSSAIEHAFASLRGCLQPRSPLMPKQALRR